MQREQLEVEIGAVKSKLRRLRMAGTAPGRGGQRAPQTKSRIVLYLSQLESLQAKLEELKGESK